MPLELFNSLFLPKSFSVTSACFTYARFINTGPGVYNGPSVSGHSQETTLNVAEIFAATAVNECIFPAP